MNKYRYTTWTATKKAVIKNHGKKVTLAYIKSGKKAGWIYKKNLLAGKAPFNKQKRLNDTYTAYMRALMPVNSNDKVNPDTTSRSYGELADSIDGSWGHTHYYSEDDVKVAIKDKDALINAYDVFKSRFSGSQRSSLDVMAKTVDNLEPITDNLDEVGSTMGTFAQALSSSVRDLN